MPLLSFHVFFPLSQNTLNSQACNSQWFSIAAAAQLLFASIFSVIIWNRLCQLHVLLLCVCTCENVCVGKRIYESSHGPVCAINASQTALWYVQYMQWLANRGQLPYHPSQFNSNLIFHCFTCTKHEAQAQAQALYTTPRLCVHPSQTFISYINCSVYLTQSYDMA